MTSLAQTIGRAHAANELNTKAKEFVNLARLIAMSRGEHVNMRHIVRNDIGDTARIALGPTVKGIVNGNFRVYEFDARQKAAALAGGTAVGDWSEQLAVYDTLAASFLSSLKSFGAFDRMLADGAMRRVPFRTRIGIATTGATGATVGQGAPKPISRLTLSTSTVDEIKATCIVIVTDELIKFGSAVAGDLLAVEMANAVSVSTNSAFISILTTGVTAIPSTGVTAEGVRNDLRAMLASITTTARSRLYLLVPSAVAKTLAVLHDNTGSGAFDGLTVNGGSIAGIEVVVSDGVSANTAVLVDASQIVAASETLQLSASNEASVQMDTAPDSPPTSSSNMVSLWTMNMSGLKCERYFAATKLSTTGVASLSGITYIGDSPGP